MADQEALTLLLGEPKRWNDWRWNHPDKHIDFREVQLAGLDLRGRMLRGCNFYRANLAGVNLRDCHMQGGYFTECCFDGADLSGANLLEANLFKASLVRARCVAAKLVDANLSYANFQHATLVSALLNKSQMVGTNFSHADMTGVHIFGASVWLPNLEGAVQSNIVITDFNEPEIACDNVEIAQFLHLLLNNKKLRDVIDTVTSKVVLILGRFSASSLPLLNNLRDLLRSSGYVPVLFDFEKPANRDLTETVSTIAHLSRFIVADISEPRCVPHELASIAKNLLSVPIVPLLRNGEDPYGMFNDIARLPNLLAIHKYESASDIDILGLVAMAESKVKALRQDTSGGRA
jgi:hypothetical protein